MSLMKILIILMKINLSTSYTENNKKICLYIKNIKIFREILDR